MPIAPATSVPAATINHSLSLVVKRDTTRAITADSTPIGMSASPAWYPDRWWAASVHCVSPYRTT